MRDNIIVNVKDYDKVIIKEGSNVKEVLQLLNNVSDVIAVYVNEEIRELSWILTEDCEVKLIKANDKVGRRIYTAGLKFLYITAIKELYGKDTVVSLMHSLDKGIYTYLYNNVTDNTIEEIKSKMKEIVERDLPITKISALRENAIEYFEEEKDNEKANLLRQMSSEYVTIYRLLDYYNYFYYFMPISTGILKDFDLTRIDNHGIVLRFPDSNDNSIPEYQHVPEILNEFQSYRKWAEMINIRYVSDINNNIIENKIMEFIQLNELKQNEMVHSIGDEICQNKGKIKIIMIGGPTSSGKTTVSKKIALDLKTRGINTLILSVDDYYLNREDTPKDEKGEYLYDIIEAVDIELFNNQLTDLINNKAVVTPKFNFISGKKEFNKKPTKLNKDDIIIIEGLHTLNEKLISGIKRENKYKIYISPFTPLSLDKHNHVSTIDVRFLRRLVRDFRYRGYSVNEIFRIWENVRIAEDKYVFPCKNEADKVFNTALIYEIGVLKTYALPLLYSLKEEDKYYEESLRLIKFLNVFFNIPGDYLPATSLLREFVGDSYFE